MNFITLKKWENYIKENKFLIVNIFDLDEKDIKKYENQTIYLINPDCDFPPPFKDYTYPCDKKYKGLKDDYKIKKYKEKINYQIIDCLDKYNINIICYSSSVFHPKIKVIPLGISWQISLPKLGNKKEILCYANFGIPIKNRWFGNPRKETFEIIKNKKWITKENINFDNDERKKNNNYNNFFYKLSISKFSICPRGCGIDSYRVYDSIYYKCVPIMLKNEDYYLNFKEFPILFIDDYNQLTEEFLINNYEKFNFDNNILNLNKYKI